MELLMIKLSDSVVINARFVTRAEWVTSTSVPYKAGPGPDKTVPGGKSETERWLDVYVIDRKEPYHLRGELAEAVWATLAPTNGDAGRGPALGSTGRIARPNGTSGRREVLSCDPVPEQTRA